MKNFWFILSIVVGIAMIGSTWAYESTPECSAESDYSAFQNASIAEQTASSRQREAGESSRALTEQNDTSGDE